MPGVSLDPDDEALVERAVQSACIRYRIAPRHREVMRQQVFEKLLKMRRRFEGRGGVPFPAYAWKGLIGAAVDAVDREDGTTRARRRRGCQLPRQFAENEQVGTANAGAFLSSDDRDELEQVLAPLRACGGLLETVYMLTHRDGRSVRNVAASLKIGQGVVRRLKGFAERIVTCAKARLDTPKQSSAQPSSDMDVQMDRYDALHASLSQLRAEVQLLVQEFGREFDDAALRKHFETTRAIFEAGDPVTAMQVFRWADRLMQLHRRLIKLSIQLVAERSAARADDRQLRLFFD